MASTYAFTIGSLLLATCFLAATGVNIDYSKYDFIVKPKPKNISCYECKNFDYNTSADADEFAMRNKLCTQNPGRVTLFKKKCSSERVQGCASIVTDYKQFSHSENQRRVFHVVRFCTDSLLSSCQVKESSRGTITLCTCTSDFCNSGPTLHLIQAVPLILSAVAVAMVTNLGSNCLFS